MELLRIAFSTLDPGSRAVTVHGAAMDGASTRAVLLAALDRAKLPKLKRMSLSDADQSVESALDEVVSKLYKRLR